MSIRLGDTSRERGGPVAGNERDGAPTKTSARHAGAEARVVSLRKRDHRVELRARHLEVIAQGRVASIHERADGGDVPLLEERCGVDRPRVLRYDMARAPTRHRVELSLARRERRDVDVS